MGVLILCFLRCTKPKYETVQLMGGELNLCRSVYSPFQRSEWAWSWFLEACQNSELQNIISAYFPMEELDRKWSTYLCIIVLEGGQENTEDTGVDGEPGRALLFLPSKCIFSWVGANGIYRSRYTRDSQLLKRDLVRCGEKENHGYGWLHWLLSKP